MRFQAPLGWREQRGHDQRAATGTYMRGVCGRTSSRVRRLISISSRRAGIVMPSPATSGRPRHCMSPVTGSAATPSA